MKKGAIQDAIFRILVTPLAFLICTSQKINRNYIKNPQILFRQQERYVDNRMGMQIAGCEKMLDMLNTNFEVLKT